MESCGAYRWSSARRAGRTDAATANRYRCLCNGSPNPSPPCKTSATDANEILDLTRQAFREWDLIREDPMAGNYLIAMLLGK